MEAKPRLKSWKGPHVEWMSIPFPFLIFPICYLPQQLIYSPISLSFCIHSIPLNPESSPVYGNEKFKCLSTYASSQTRELQSWKGPNTLGPQVLQSWRGRVPRVPLSCCARSGEATQTPILRIPLPTFTFIYFQFCG